MLKKIIGPLTWAYVIIVGGLMITPEGVNPIVTNPAFRTIISVVSIILGVIFLSSYSIELGGRTENS